MQVQDVEYYLNALDEALVAQGIITPIPVLLLGGAYIMLQINARRTTQDIDIFPFVGNEQDQATGISLAVALYQATETVAQRYQLHPHWLNTVRKGALQPAGTEPARTLWKRYRVLEVFLPDPEYILLQKLLINRRKDREDILALFHALGITERVQAEEFLDRFISKSEQQRFAIMLESYFQV